VPSEIASAFREQQAAQEKFLHERQRIDAVHKKQLRQIASHLKDLEVIYNDIDLSESNRLKAMLDYSVRNLKNSVENTVRKEFGESKVGEAEWAGESVVYKIVCDLFPTHTVLRHQNPEWLDGLELDIYVPQLAFAVEYQGEQHYLPISAWGGQAALNERKQRDQRKAQLCKKNGIALIAIDYDEPLTKEHISDLLRNYLA